MGKREPNEQVTFTRKPMHEFKTRLSQDGKYWMFQNITTWIIPTNYLSTIYKNKNLGANGAAEKTRVLNTETVGEENGRSNSERD